MSMTSGLQSLQAALAFEKEGYDYYEQAAGRAAHPQTRAAFLLLKDEEKKHADFLLQLHARWSADGKWPGDVTIDMDRDFEMIFKEAAASIDEKVQVGTAEEKALKDAVDLENRGRAMYAGLSEKAETPEEKALYAKLADWEASHAAFVEDHLAYFEDKGLFMDE